MGLAAGRSGSHRVHRAWGTALRTVETFAVSVSAKNVRAVITNREGSAPGVIYLHRVCSTFCFSHLSTHARTHAHSSKDNMLTDLIKSNS